MLSQKPPSALVKKVSTFKFYFMGSHIKEIAHLAFLIIAAGLRGQTFELSVSYK